LVFSSLIFLLGFLPITLGVYHATQALGFLGLGTRRAWRHVGNFTLLLASLVFYGWGEFRLLWVMLAAIAVNFVAGIGIDVARQAAVARGGDPARAGRVWSWIAVGGSLALLAFFKYGGFAVDNWNGFARLLGLGSLATDEAFRVALPVGISFYTFQALSYVIDVRRGEVRATRNLVDFACYVTMFPQLVAGPIVRYADIARELVDRAHTLADAAAGALRFAIGFGKKLLVANVVAVPADAVFGMHPDALSPAHAWLGVVCYSLQIYFDFSAYSDMAIGLGRMMGFHFVENFDHPYVARSNQDFWRRWHISLSTWFRDYLYIPLGGNRGGSFATYRNLLVVFLLCGLWHGASWCFVAWGAYHGLFLALERWFLGRWLAASPRPLQHAYLLLVAMSGWVLFRADTLSQACAVYAALAGCTAATGPVAHLLDARTLTALAAGVAFAMPLAPAIAAHIARVEAGGGAAAAAAAGFSTLARPVLVAGLLALGLAALAAGTHNPFIYFRF
jgi:alginate O-acetyltransferase complex protein AlgI